MRFLGFLAGGAMAGFSFAFSGGLPLVVGLLIGAGIGGLMERWVPETESG